MHARFGVANHLEIMFGSYATRSGCRDFNFFLKYPLKAHLPYTGIRTNNVQYSKFKKEEEEARPIPFEDRVCSLWRIANQFLPPIVGQIVPHPHMSILVSN